MRGDSVGNWIIRRRLIFRKTSLFWSLLVIIIIIDIYYLSIDVTLKVSAGPSCWVKDTIFPSKHLPHENKLYSQTASRLEFGTGLDVRYRWCGHDLLGQSVSGRASAAGG